MAKFEIPELVSAKKRLAAKLEAHKELVDEIQRRHNALEQLRCDLAVATSSERKAVGAAGKLNAHALGPWVSRHYPSGRFVREYLRYTGSPRLDNCMLYGTRHNVWRLSVTAYKYNGDETRPFSADITAPQLETPGGLLLAFEAADKQLIEWGFYLVNDMGEEK